VRALVLAALLAGCAGGDQYELQIAFATPDLEPEAEVVYVWLVDTCPPEANLAQPSLAPHATSIVRRGAAADPLGELPEGPYAFHVLARNGRCNVVAAGCTAVTLRSGDEETIVVTLSAPPGTPSCAAGEVCGQGQCLPEGSCAEIGSACGPELSCCTGTCAPENMTCVGIAD